MSVYEQSSQNGIAFFSKIAATFTHDIKNVLAIINENAGLLEDLSLMASKGYPLNIEKVVSIAGKVQSQVQRADDMVGRMNTFAHSNDSPQGPIDLKEALELLLAMTKRILAKKNVSFFIQAPPRDNYIIQSQPFFVFNFLWFCIEKAIEFCNDTRSVGLELEKKDGAFILVITGIQLDQSLSMTDAEEFMEILGVNYTFERQIQKHQFSFPVVQEKVQK